MWTTLSSLNSGDSYQVISAISDATVDQLRAAGTQYPAPIRERYLQLPNSLPQRVRDLARQIVTDAKATNPYDQAAALESWLRTQIKYNDQISAPAPGQDGVDYVLFETREGYCDYYASAFAVMARSLGLPSRIATGYAQGELDSKRNVYQVYQYNAHTWPEIYFPTYGWIQFEPTASQPAIERPKPAADAKNADPAANDGNNPTRTTGRSPKPEEEDPFAHQSGTSAALAALAARAAPSVPVVIGIVLAGLGLLVASVAGGMWWYENRGVPALRTGGGSWAFAHLGRMANWLRIKITAAHTPYEQAQLIGQVIPRRAEAIEQLTAMYVRERYGRSEIVLNEARSIWRSIHWSLWWTGFKRRVGRALPAFKKR